MRRLLGYRRGIRADDGPPDPTIDPNSIPDLTMWFDAANASSVTYGVGTNVASIANLATGYTSYKMSTEGVASREPAYLATGLNGKGCIEFTQLNSQYLRLCNAANVVQPPNVVWGSTNYPFTMIVVAFYDAPTTNFTGPDVPGAYSGAVTTALPYFGEAVFGMRATFGIVPKAGGAQPTLYATIYTAEAVAAPGPVRYIVTSDPTNQTRMSVFSQAAVAAPGTADFTLRENSVLKGTIAGQQILTTILGSTSYPWSMGRGYPGALPAYHFKGKVGEILFYERALNASEVSSLEAHLTNKWGL